MSVRTVQATLSTMPASGHLPFHNATAESKTIFSPLFLFMFMPVKNLTVNFYHFVSHLFYQISLPTREAAVPVSHLFLIYPPII